MATTINRITEVRPADRIDLIAFRVLGNSHSYKSILELNPNLDIWAPKAGTIIKVPDAR